MNDAPHRNRDTYGPNLAAFLRESRLGELAAFVDAAGQEYWDSIAMKYFDLNEECVAQLRGDLAAKQHGLMMDLEGAPASTSYDEYNLISRLVYTGELEKEYLTKELDLSDILRLGPKLAATLRNQSLMKIKWTTVGAEEDYNKLMALQVDPEGIKVAYGRQLTSDTYVFSNLYWGPFRNIKGWSVADGKLACDGRSFALSPDKTLGGSGFIKDTDKFAAFLSEKTGANVKMLSGDWAVHHIVSFLLARVDVIIDANKGPRVVNIGSVDSKQNHYYKGLKWASGNKLIESFEKWATQCQPPINLLMGTWKPAYYHFILDWGMRNDPKSAPNMASVNEYVDMVIRPTILAKVTEWRQFADAKDVYLARHTTGAIWKGIGDTCADLKTRRAAENANAGYNRVFETSDASLCGFEDLDQADIAKHQMVLNHFQQQLLTYSNVDVYGSAGGNPCAAIRTINDKATIACYHITDAKDNRYPLKVWDMTDGYKGSGEFLYDMSYGVGSKVAEMNRLKVGMLKKTRYELGAVKFTLTEESAITTNSDGSNSLPYGMEDIGGMYEYVEVLCPGKLHSPELFVIFTGKMPTGRTDALRIKISNSQKMTGVLQHKSMMMQFANNIRATMWNSCFPLGYGFAVPVAGGPMVETSMKAIGYVRLEVRQEKDLDDVIHIPDRKKRIGEDEDEAMDRAWAFYSNRQLFEARASAQSEAMDVLSSAVPSSVQEREKETEHVPGSDMEIGPASGSKKRALEGKGSVFTK